MCGASGVGCSCTPDHRPSFGAGGQGPLPTGCGSGGCISGDPSPNPQRALLRAGFPSCGGGTRVPREGAPCLGVGRPGRGALPPLIARPFGRAAKAHYPLAVGGRGDPSPTPQRALLRAGCARCGGGTRAPGLGASCLGVGRLGTAALPPPTARPLGRAAGANYPLAVSAGAAGVGTRHQPHSARSCELPWHAVGAGQGPPWGGASCLGVGRLGSGALPPLTARSLGRAAGANYRLAVGAGGAGVGTRHRPHSAVLRAGCARCGGGTRAPGGHASCLKAGRPGSGALPPPTAHPFSRAARAHYRLAVGAGGGRGGNPSPVPQRALLRAGFARCGGGTRAPGVAWVWGVRGQALSHHRPPVLWGLWPGPTTHRLLVRVVRAWGAVTTPQWALLRAVFARCGGGTRAPGGGVPLAWEWGVPVGRSPNPNRPSFWACGRGPLPTGCGCGGCGLGDPSPGPQRALLRAGFAGCGGGTWAPGGGASRLGVGRPGSGALPPLTARLLGRAAGAQYPLAVVAGATGVGTRHQPHSAHSCVLALRAVGAGGRPGRPFLPGCGVSGVGRLPTPDRPSFGACSRGSLPTGCGCGGCGPGDPSPAPQCALLRAGFARCWGGTRAPGGGASCVGAERLGLGALPPPTRPSFRACGQGPLPTGCGCAVRAWEPSCPWHLFLCRGSSCDVCRYRVCGTRWPLPLGTCPCAVVVAGDVPLWRALWPRVVAPRLVRSGRSRCSGRLSCCRCALSPPGGCRPRLYWVAARGTWRPAENRALCPCRKPLPRQGPWAGIVPGGSLGLRYWAACAAVVLCVWTSSLTHPVSCTVFLSTVDSAGAPGLFRWTPTPPPSGRRTPRPGSAPVCVRALLGWVGQAGLLSALWCA